MGAVLDLVVPNNAWLRRLLWRCVGVVRRRHRHLLHRLAVAAADAVEADLRRLAHAVAVATATVLRCLALVSCDDTVEVAASVANRSRNREGSLWGDRGISRVIRSGVVWLGDSGHFLPPVRSIEMQQAEESESRAKLWVASTNSL